MNGPRQWLHKTGYYCSSYGGKTVYTHRLIWFWRYGYWPRRLDHINRVKTDNRIENLREVTAAQSAQNRAFIGRYLSKCIYFDPTHQSPKKYRVRVQAEGRRRHIGWYLTEAEAQHAATAAVKQYHGDFGLTLLD
jgi:hypothetical protein